MWRLTFLPLRILGAIIQSASYKVRDLVAGRVIAGLSVGIASSVIPIYIVTPSTASRRLVTAH